MQITDKESAKSFAVNSIKEFTNINQQEYWHNIARKVPFDVIIKAKQILEKTRYQVCLIPHVHLNSN